MDCFRCDKEIAEGEIYTHKGQPMCEDCLMYIGLFPLEHSGQYRSLFHIKDSNRHI
jgi:hypothetical protein